MNLKEFQKKSNKTIKENADNLELPFSTYNNYLLGTREPKIDMLIKMANYFGCSVDELIGNEKKTATNSPEKENLLNTINNLTEIECHKLNVFAQGLIMNRIQEQKQRTNKLINLINEEE